MHIINVSQKELAWAGTRVHVPVSGSVLRGQLPGLLPRGNGHRADGHSLLAPFLAVIRSQDARYLVPRCFYYSVLN